MKKLSKYFVALMLVFSFVLASAIGTTTNISAAEHGYIDNQTTPYNLIVGIDNNSDKVTNLQVTTGTNPAYSVTSDFDNEMFWSADGRYTVALTVDFGQPLADASYGVTPSNDASPYMSNVSTTTSGTAFTYSFSFDGASFKTAKNMNRISLIPYYNTNNTNQNGQNGQNGQRTRAPFSGKVWFFWDCGGDFCNYLIENIDGTESAPDPTTGEEMLTYHTKYVPASTIISNGKTPDITALNNADGSYYFVWQEAGDSYLASNNPATWSDFKSWFNVTFNPTPTQTEQQGSAMRDFAADPTGASKGANIISTNGDRDFRLTIYNAGSYYGISNASNPNDLTYYPNFWDQAFFNPAYDVSNTSLENPMIIQSYLLEPKVTLTSDPISTPISNIEVVSPNVSASAISITNQGNDTFDIHFNSNYFDNVVFRVTSSNKTYYVAIVRVVVGYDFGVFGLYVPENDTNEYSVLANYYWSDGTEKTFTLEEAGRASGGKGLTFRGYEFSQADSGQVQLSPDAGNAPSGVYYTVVKAGSTATKYNGTLSGSGKGTHYTNNRGNFALDITK